MGRKPPISGRKDQLLAVKVTPGLIAAVDRWATNRSLTRPDAVRQLIRLGLHVPADVETAIETRAREGSTELSKLINP